MQAPEFVVAGDVMRSTGGSITTIEMGTAPPIVPGNYMLRPMNRFTHHHVELNNCSFPIAEHSLLTMALIGLSCACKRTDCFSLSPWPLARTRLHLAPCSLPLTLRSACPHVSSVSFVSAFSALFRPLPCGHAGTMEATARVSLVLLDCLSVWSRPSCSSSGGPHMVRNFITSVEES